MVKHHSITRKLSYKWYEENIKLLQQLGIEGKDREMRKLDGNDEKILYCKTMTVLTYSKTGGGYVREHGGTIPIVIPCVEFMYQYGPQNQNNIVYIY